MTCNPIAQELCILGCRMKVLSDGQPIVGMAREAAKPSRLCLWVETSSLQFLVVCCMCQGLYAPLLLFFDALCKI